MFAEQTKNVWQKWKDLINGYIRNMQVILPKDETFYNIPPLINHICLIYYGSTDEWDSKYISKKMKLQDNCITNISDVAYEYVSAFGRAIISSGKFHWKFKIEKVQKTGWYIVIGIWKIKSEVEPPKETYFTHKGYKSGYGFVTEDGKLVTETGGSSFKKYGVPCKTGDIIDMYLDLDKLTLSFAINGTDYGPAFRDIENTSYRMALNMQQKGDSLRLLN